MKRVFGSWFIIVAIMVSACGRDQQPSAPAPAPTAPAPAPVIEAAPTPEVGGVGGYCGILCRMRLRRMQRRQGCW